MHQIPRGWTVVCPEPSPDITESETITHQYLIQVGFPMALVGAVGHLGHGGQRDENGRPGVRPTCPDVPTCRDQYPDQ